VLSSTDIKQRAREIGFDACGIAPATDLPELAALAAWLEQGYAGEMIYMHKSADTRADVRRFLPGARSVVMTASVYNTVNTPAPEREPPAGTVRVARYARGEDYHLVLAERLQSLVDWMRGRHAEPFQAAVFVDKHHVQERVYARHAGLGWIAKNTCLINPEIGSWVLLAGVATDLPLEPDAPGFDQCGECTLCLDACPTGALVDAHVLDATKCISYLTIEVEGSVPDAQRSTIGQHLFGCDICQSVCPWNLAAPVTSDASWLPRTRRDGASAAELWQRTDQELHAYVRGSAMMHTTLARLRRNLAIVIGNTGDPALATVLDRPGHGIKNAAHSAQAPLVRDAVDWAKHRLAEVKSEKFRG
jgi:epoxyqueuosine reductase